MVLIHRVQEWWYNQLSLEMQQDANAAAELLASSVPVALTMFHLYAKLKYGYIYRAPGYSLSMEDSEFVLRNANLSNGAVRWNVGGADGKQDPRLILDLALLTMLQTMDSVEPPARSYKICRQECAPISAGVEVSQ
ncbi:hypothetical protein [Ktedonobacter sp. SOSP1-52]|uniref:hypothetical protein n=1 Tax=Ktedonobacter sp. SOSP1-52 TaxID=2778366 RepID=UPI001915B368|nr:hypothetical protein [Ktedonobacter sp. SOSP1-52]